MMATVYRIPLRVTNIDLDDDDVVDAIGEHLSDLAWMEVAGRVIAVLFCNTTDPVSIACETARAIMNRIAGAKVLEVDDEIVNISDIANRIGVSREAVRHWVEGRRGPGGFPEQFNEVGEKLERLWRWEEVLPWLQEHYAFEEEYQRLTREQVIRVNTSILRVTDHFDFAWTTEYEISRDDTSDDRQSLISLLPRHMLRGILERENIRELELLDLPSGAESESSDRVRPLSGESVYDASGRRL